MAGEDRDQAAAVALFEQLHQAPYKFDFYQALRRFECAFADKPRLGHSQRPVDDPIRLGQEPSLGFAPASLAGFTPGQKGLPGRLNVYLFGLLGPNGPLPLHLTEHARDRLRNHHDPTFARFLDIFHHRLLTLFYRSWASAQPTVNYDRPKSDRFALYVGSTFGLGMPSLRHRDSLPDLAKLHYAGRFACPTRNREGLRGIVGGFFGLPVEIEEFVGQWLELREVDFCRLGALAGISSLGRSITVGSRTWECQQKFRIVLGPLSLGQYESLLPGRENQGKLIALVRNYIGRELDWDVRLILRKREVPPLQLGGKGALGRTTWLLSHPRDRDADDLSFSPEEVAA
jgi:type VI secretion system protein ImpH